MKKNSSIFITQTKTCPQQTHVFLTYPYYYMLGTPYEIMSIISSLLDISSKHVQWVDIKFYDNNPNLSIFWRIIDTFITYVDSIDMILECVHW